MVYILAVNKYLPYENGRSKILYQGTTKKGAGRPAVNKASDVYYKLHGGKTIDVQIATCAKRNKVQT